jgi:cytochrome P450
MPTAAKLPGPRGLPLLGNLLQLDLRRLHRVLADWCDTFGPLYEFKLGRRPVVVVADPELVQHVLRRRPKEFRRLGTIEPVFKEMGLAGVFSAEGEDWRRQRRLVAHALDAKHLRQFFPTLMKVTERLRNRWRKAADADLECDVQKDLMRYTVDVTTNLTFGYDMNTLESEGDVVQDHLEKIFPMINRRINAPFPYWRHFKLPVDRALDRSLHALRDVVDGFIRGAKARLAARPELKEHPTDLLEAMLSARDEGGVAFTDEEIAGNALTMLLGGEDTTANTLAWLVHYLLEHPATQDRLRDEARPHVRDGGLLASLSATEELVYADAAAQEAMRLKPVGPIIFLETNEEATLGGAVLPPRTAMMLLTLHAPLQDERFAEASVFRPERWLDATAASTGAHDVKSFVPFGAGPRFCPGAQLAMVEIKAVLSMLVSEFEAVKTEDPRPVEEVFSFTMFPANLRVRLRRRA